MREAQILVVEGEGIFADHIKDRLKGMGYRVPAVVASGQDALQTVGELWPDLVLMDIKLEGEIDAVAASGEIRTRFDIGTNRVPVEPVRRDRELGDQARGAHRHAVLTEPAGNEWAHRVIVSVNADIAEQRLEVTHLVLVHGGLGRGHPNAKADATRALDSPDRAGERSFPAEGVVRCR